MKRHPVISNKLSMVALRFLIINSLSLLAEKKIKMLWPGLIMIVAILFS